MLSCIRQLLIPALNCFAGPLWLLRKRPSLSLGVRMSARMLIVLAVPAVLALAPSSSTAQATAAAPPGAARSQPSAPARIPDRPVRRDIPMTNAIRRAFAAGTRDSTGRPGRNYWQLWTDYTINARLEPATSRVTGRESIVLHNNSDSAMRTIVMRLDQHIYAANVPRA